MSEGPGDTIAAIATARGAAGVGVVRASGPGVPDIARAVLGDLPPPRRAALRDFLDRSGEPIDRGIALRFDAPASYTGEHVLELQGHGGVVVLELLLARLIELGARPAGPGEFTERAFLHDRLDLVQAEAVADLIESRSAAAARAALRSLEGAFSRRVGGLHEALVDLRVWIESALDFSDEDVQFLGGDALAGRTASLADDFDDLIRRVSQGRRLREGLNVVIAGRPNVGKSSLMNALSEDDVAIVTDVAGTTRDVLHAEIVLDGLPLHLVDTAGLHDADDPVEREGMRRAGRALAVADHVLIMVDASAPLWPHLEKVPDATLTVLVNKLDLVDDESAVLEKVRSALSTGEAPDGLDPAATLVPLSVATGRGLDTLRRRLVETAGVDGDVERAFGARRRHVEALIEARDATMAAVRSLEGEAAHPELAAEALREAQRALDRITGRFDTEDLLGRIFSTFCIGK